MVEFDEKLQLFINDSDFLTVTEKDVYCGGLSVDVYHKADVIENFRDFKQLAFNETCIKILAMQVLLSETSGVENCKDVVPSLKYGKNAWARVLYERDGRVLYRNWVCRPFALHAAWAARKCNSTRCSRRGRRCACPWGIRSWCRMSWSCRRCPRRRA